MKRNSTIDCIRVLAIIKVISVHVETIKSLHHEWSAIFMSHVNFAVAFFIVISGYQWGKKIRAGNPVGQAYAKYSLGLLKLFVLWSLFYIFVADGAISEYTHYGILSPLKICYWNCQHLLLGRGSLWKGVLDIFLDGTKYHLWFLMGLVWAATITAILVKLKRESWLIWVGLTLYVFQALVTILSETSIGFSLPFNVIHGPFLATFFFVVGWRLSSRQGTFSLKPAIALLSAGFAVLVIGLFVVRSGLGFMAVKPFFETTLGIGAAMLALSRPSLGADTILASLGQRVLGIYLIHPVFINFLRPLWYYIPSPVRDIGFTVMVFFSSVLAVLILQQIRILGPFFATSKIAKPADQRGTAVAAIG